MKEVVYEENDNSELSKLRNELYKTTILLKETSEQSEKENLKDKDTRKIFKIDKKEGRIIYVIFNWCKRWTNDT